MQAPPARSSAIKTIVTAWLVVGILDITSAIVIWLSRGITVTRGLQGIAAGLLGAPSYEHGTATALFGLAIHFFVALVVVAVFYFVSRLVPFLTKHALLSGVLYGTGVYLFMYWVVLPTTFPAFRHRFSNEILALAVHVCLIGLPTALIVRRGSRLK